MMILHKTISKHSANSEQSMLNLVFFTAIWRLSQISHSRPETLRKHALAQECPCAGYDWNYKTQMGLISRMWYVQNGNSTAYRPHEHSGHTNDGTRHMGMENVCPANLPLPSHTQTISQMRHSAFPVKRLVSVCQLR